MELWEVAPVVTLKPLVEAVKTGAAVEVTAYENVVSNSGAVAGKWLIFLLPQGESTTGTTKAVLIKQRGAKPRMFNTANGLIGIALELGVEEIAIPHIKGQSVIWRSTAKPGVTKGEGTQVLDGSGSG